jgi:DNA mismatch repair protein MSH6
VSVLEGLKGAIGVKDLLESANVQSSLLRKIASKFPDMREPLGFFERAFDPSVAKREGTIKPKPGVDEEYDDAKRRVQEVKEELDRYLGTQRERLGCKDISYYHSAKDK